MGLARYQVQRANVPLPGGESMSVRGLNTVDVTTLLNKHLDDVEELYGLFSQAKLSIYSRKAMDGFIMSCVAKAPKLVAEVISICSDEPGTEEQAGKLPIVVQIAGLSEIVRLSVVDAGGLKNLMALLGTVANEVLPREIRENLGRLAEEMKTSMAAQSAVKH